MPISFTVNGTGRQVDVPVDTPLLYVLRNDLQVGSPQFGCGLSQCGACSVLVDGKEVRSCVLAVRSVADKEVTTIEGLPARWATVLGRPRARPQAHRRRSGPGGLTTWPPGLSTSGFSQMASASDRRAKRQWASCR